MRELAGKISYNPLHLITIRNKHAHKCSFILPIFHSHSLYLTYIRPASGPIFPILSYVFSVPYFPYISRNFFRLITPKEKILNPMTLLVLLTSPNPRQLFLQSLAFLNALLVGFHAKEYN